MPAMQALALDFDTSLDDEIRKNYNPSKIEEDMALPALPKILDDSTDNEIPVNRYQSQTKTQAQSLQPIKKAVLTNSCAPAKTLGGSYAVLKKGTKFKTGLVTNVSDFSRKGSTVTLVTRYPVSTTYLTIPTGTILEGKVISSHPPQFTGNGGQIKFKITSMKLNDATYPMSAFVTEANHKNIFFNNIKGQRKYAKSMFRAMKPGVGFYKKMTFASARLLNDGVNAFLSPIPFATAILGLGANVMISPAIAVFSKGSSINLKSGNNVEIKLSEEMVIYN